MPQQSKKMRLQIILNTKDSPLELPIAHHHILQSVFYSLMKDDKGNSGLHDRGYDYEKRSFKLFTFGPIIGKYRISGSKISFIERSELEFRSTDGNVVRQMAENAKKIGVRFGSNNYLGVDVVVTDPSEKIFDDELTITMKSPICVYRTDSGGHTTFFNTSEDEFYDAVAENFRRKYVAAFGKSPETGIELLPYRVGARDKYFTKYKGFYIEAYKGKYILKGKPEYLRFLYDVGLGGKNSQGFGMFSVNE